MDEILRRELEAIRNDRQSGATALVGRGIRVLQQAAVNREWLEAAARDLCHAQPSMAGFRTAAALALSADDPASALEALARAVQRAPAAIARHTAQLLAGESPHQHGPLRVVTVSRSQAVEEAVVALGRIGNLIVCCAEGRPALEGRRLGEALARQHIAVELYTDAGISGAVRSAHAVLVGADAIGPTEFLNKVGTAAVCALASLEGVPVYVLSGREKVLTAAVFEEMESPPGPNSEVWESAPAGIQVRNLYFERAQLSLATGLITEVGVIPTEQVGDLVLRI